jgi:hypothetical protein
VTRRVIRGRGGAWWARSEKASQAAEHVAGPAPSYQDLRLAALRFADELETEALRLGQDAERFATRGFRQLAGELRGLRDRILELAGVARNVRDVE